MIIFQKHFDYFSKSSFHKLEEINYCNRLDAGCGNEW